jgi:hypothetical protein
VIHRNLLLFRGARYLWWSLGLLIASGVLYATQGNVQPPNGGTWQGYVLGTLGALLILWLTLLGVRKRSYHSTLGSVQGWTSAHVYLGTALLIIATLHTGFQVGWNLHTLAYLLMCVVIASGFFGLYSYLNHPVLISKNREGGGRAELFAELFELDKQSRSLSQKCAPEVGIAVASSIERTTLGGGVYAQLFSGDDSYFVRGAGAPVRNTDQQGVIDFVAERLPRAQKGVEAANLQQLIVLLCRRQAVLRRIRRDIRLRGWLKIWLYFHIPVTFALLAALVVHIASTFVYW